MAHTLQERYASLVDAKLRLSMVKRDGVVFGTRYEGSPKAGKVKIPVRDTEVTVTAYDKANGVAGATGATTYLDMAIDKDYAVNEIIDGFDAASVPDNLVADRLDSAAYSLALQQENDATDCLEKAATTIGTTTALTKSTVYEALVDARTALSTLEMVVLNGDLAPDGSVTVTADTLEQCTSQKSLLYDKTGEEHYNLISALHKSMRNSDPDAAVYWLARMLEAGEDPLYIARRVTRFASEDVGLADPRALELAVAAYQA